jgi:hypothetical protein
MLNFLLDVNVRIAFTNFHQHRDRKVAVLLLQKLHGNWRTNHALLDLEISRKCCDNFSELSNKMKKLLLWLLWQLWASLRHSRAFRFLA